MSTATLETRAECSLGHGWAWEAPARYKFSCCVRTAATTSLTLEYQQATTNLPATTLPAAAISRLQQVGFSSPRPPPRPTARPSPRRQSPRVRTAQWPGARVARVSPCAAIQGRQGGGRGRVGRAFFFIDKTRATTKDSRQPTVHASSVNVCQCLEAVGVASDPMLIRLRAQNTAHPRRTDALQSTQGQPKTKDPNNKGAREPMIVSPTPHERRSPTAPAPSHPQDCTHQNIARLCRLAP